MKIKFKGQNPTSKGIPTNERGRTYLIGEIVAGVSLTDDGLTITITNHGLANEFKKVIKNGKDTNYCYACKTYHKYNEACKHESKN